MIGEGTKYKIMHLDTIHYKSSGTGNRITLSLENSDPHSQQMLTPPGPVTPAPVGNINRYQ